MEYRENSRETTVAALSPSGSVTDREKEQGVRATGVLVLNGDICVTNVKLVEGHDSMYVRFPGYYSEKDSEFKPYVSGTSREFCEAAASAMAEARESGGVVQKELPCDRNAVRFNPYSREGSDLAGFATLACSSEGKQLFAVNTIKIHDKGDRLAVEPPEGVILPPHLKREIALECISQHPELDRTKPGRDREAQQEAKDGSEKDAPARHFRRRKAHDIEQ